MSSVTEGFRMPGGKHKGELITEVPVSYLRWMVREVHQHSGLAREELERRGGGVPKMEISAHAVDRASQRLLVYWQESRVGDEGLHTWLTRLAHDAFQYGKRQGDNRRIHKGIAFAFEWSGKYPTLKSVYVTNRPSRRSPKPD